MSNVRVIDRGDSPLICRITMGRPDRERNYVLTIPRENGLEEVRRGDVISARVRVLTHDGRLFFMGMVEGRVIYVGKRVVRVWLPAKYRVLAEIIYRNRWPVFVFSLTLASSQNGDEVNRSGAS